MLLQVFVFAYSLNLSEPKHQSDINVMTTAPAIRTSLISGKNFMTFAIKIKVI